MALSTLGAQFIYPDSYIKFGPWFLGAADAITDLQGAVSALGAVEGFGTLFL